MNKLTETQHYIIYKEYESVILKIKNNHRMVQIGDFYGDAQMAVISEDESFCAIVRMRCNNILFEGTL